MTNSAEDIDLRDLYRELILDHARHPRHFGELPDATHRAEGVNPLCGDRMTLYLKLNEKNDVENAGFVASGCAISIASASLLTDIVAGRPANDVLAIGEALVRRLTDDDSAQQPLPDKLLALEGVKEFPARVKCATLAWHALAAAISESAETATTE